MKTNIETGVVRVPSTRDPQASVSFGDVGSEEEEAEREEYDLPNRGETDLRRSDRFSGLVPANETAELVLDDLDLLKPPADPAP